MSRDVIVHWSAPGPSRENLQAILEDYLGPLIRVEWQKDRYFVTLGGLDSFANRREPAVWSEHVRAAILTEKPDIRAFEVWPAPDGGCTYVMTRHADEFTNAVAEGFAAVLARAWKGEISR